MTFATGRFMQMSLILALGGARCLYAQTPVTTASGTPNTVPVFVGSSIIGNSTITIDPSTNFVGIGTSSPGASLDVNGTINVNGGAVIQVPSAGNYFFAGSGNSAVQVCCNLGFGGSALATVSVGQRNVAIGQNALYLTDAGSINVAIGDQSLQNNAGGSGNTGVGGYSLFDNIGGNFNTAIGYGAIGVNPVGNFNAALGFQSMQSVISGNSNAALGTNALTGLIAGTDNVAVGDGAGDDAGGTTMSGANLNVFLGASTQALANGDSNEVVIGAYAVGGGSNTVTLGSTNIASTILRGNIIMTNGSASGSSGASVTFPDTTVQSTAWTGILTGGDYAESVDVSGDRGRYEPGDLITIDPDSPGHFKLSMEPYSPLVAGIYSTKPGVRGRRQVTSVQSMPAEIPMAMVGIVPTKVSCENGPIKAGDLLVTSSTRGTAMKGSDPTRMLGAVVGKALSSLDAGHGTIEVLVTLQ